MRTVLLSRLHMPRLIVLPHAVYARTDVDWMDDPHAHAVLPSSWRQQVRALDGRRPGGGVRGRVSGFSRASRRRLQRTLAAIDWRAGGPEQARFLTLTFHRVPCDWRARWLAWLACARRLGVRYIWRLEAQDRGAPHWHLMLWATDGALAALREDWTRIAADGSRAHRRYGWHVLRLDSYRRASAYLSKYLGKVGGACLIIDGARSWGTSRSLPVATPRCATLDQRQYVQVARTARRLARARRRERRPRAMWWRRSTWLYLPADASLRLLEWVGGVSLGVDECMSTDMMARAGVCTVRPPPMESALTARHPAKVDDGQEAPSGQLSLSLDARRTESVWYL